MYVRFYKWGHSHLHMPVIYFQQLLLLNASDAMQRKATKINIYSYYPIVPQPLHHLLDQENKSEYVTIGRKKYLSLL